MSKLFASVAALAMLTALAGSAQAEVVNDFTIEYWPRAFNGACSGTAYYGPTKTSLSIVTAYRDNTKLWGIMLANKEWKTKGNTYEVVVQAGPEKNRQYRKTITKVFSGLDDGGLLVNDLTADEINTLAFDGEATVWFINKKDGKYIASLRIDKSANVIRAVQSCLKERAPMIVNKQDETTVPKKEKTKEGAGGPYYGTGFFVAPKYVLTAYHVVEKCHKIFIKYPTYRSEQAFIIGHDKKNDLAVLKTEMTHMGLAKFRLRARLGENVYSYGFPYGNVLSSSGNFTSGLVSALTGFDDDSGLIQVSSPLQPGNSGGPLMDSSGAVIGISKGILGTLMAAEAAGGAVPQNVNFGVSAGTAVNFLATVRTGVEAEVSLGGSKLEPETIAEMAMKFTVQISCD
jgi:serine protease Do